MKKISLHIGWMLMLTLAFGAAAYAWSNEIAINIGAEPVAVDPLYAMGRVEAMVITNLYQGLVTWRDGQLVPGVAGKWIISKDGTEYRFQLQTSYWSNGDPVVAKDFEVSWFRNIHPHSKGKFNSLMSIIDGVDQYRRGEIDQTQVGIKALGRNVLWVKLKRPCSQFLSYLTLPTFMPVNARLVADNYNQSLSGECTNGPYKVGEWEKRRFMRLEPNPRFRWGQARGIDVRLIFLSSEMAASAFKAGIIHAIKSPDNRVVKDLAPYSIMRKAPSLSCSFIFFNLQRPPLNRQEIRQGFALVTNKERLIQRNLDGQGYPATGFVPYGLLDHNGQEFRSNSEIPDMILDGEQARRLFWQVGYPGETEFPPMELICREGELNQKIMENLATMWRIDLGISVVVTPLPWTEFKKRCMEGRFYLARAGWEGDYPDAMAMLELFRSDSPGNFCRYQNEEYDALLMKAEALFGTERNRVLHEAEKQLIQDLPIIPLHYGYEEYLLDKRMNDLSFTPQGFPMFWTVAVKRS